MPSKKVLIFGGASLIALGVIIFAYAYTPKTDSTLRKDVPVLTVQSQTDQLQNQFTENDADNDGLRDWEESLWGTDAQVADTDGDGTPDGQEVKNGTNPAIKGPNDKLSAKDLPSGLQASTTSSVQLTITDKASQDLFNKYMALKQSGKEITEETQTELINQMLADTASSPSGAKQYSSADFNVAKTESKESIKAYGNAMGTIIKTNGIQVETGELGLFQLAVDNHDASYLKKIDIITGAYQKMLAGMKTVSVPPSAVTVHSSVMTNLSEIIYADQQMQKLFSDPVGAALGLKQYQLAADKNRTTFSNVSAYFQKAGVSFSTNEPGYSFSRSN